MSGSEFSLGVKHSILEKLIVSKSFKRMNGTRRLSQNHCLMPEALFYQSFEKLYTKT